MTDSQEKRLTIANGYDKTYECCYDPESADFGKYKKGVQNKNLQQQKANDHDGITNNDLGASDRQPRKEKVVATTNHSTNQMQFIQVDDDLDDPDLEALVAEGLVQKVHYALSTTFH